MWEGMDAHRHEEGELLAAREGRTHGHGFGSGGGLVEERGIADLHSGQVSDHGLEVEQGLQAPLGDLGLVGGVLGVPAWVLQQVALDDRGQVRVVVAHAQVRLEDLVLVCHLPAMFGNHQIS